MQVATAVETANSQPVEGVRRAARPRTDGSRRKTVFVLLSTVLAGAACLRLWRDYQTRLAIDAMLSGHPGRVAALLRAGADANATDPARYSLLAIAIDRNEPGAVSTLLAAGADPNGSGARSISPVNLAIKDQEPDIALYLLAHGSRAWDGSPFDNPLNLLGIWPAKMRRASLQVAGELLRRGVQALGPSDVASSIHEAAANGNLPLVRLLMQHTRHGRPAAASDLLVLASALGDMSMARLAIADGALQPRYRPEVLDASLLAGAIKEQPAAVRLLLSLGADPNKRAPTGQTPLASSRNWRRVYRISFSSTPGDSRSPKQVMADAAAVRRLLLSAGARR